MITRKNKTSIRNPAVSSRASVGRFPSYLFVLKELDRLGFENVSATVLAEHIGVESISVRKDLAITGIVGKPKVGFPLKELIAAIEAYIGWDDGVEAVIVGIGSLGAALLGYDHFHDNNIKIVAGFDIDPEKIGKEIKGTPIYHIDELAKRVKKLKVKLGVITTPRGVASKVAMTMMEAGITGIWSFAQDIIPPRKGVTIQYEDLASGLAVLSMQVKRKEEQMEKAKVTVQICMGSSCFARGGSKYIEKLEAYVRDHDQKGEIELIGSRCSGNCLKGPNVIVNDESFHNVPIEKIIEHIESILNE